MKRVICLLLCAITFACLLPVSAGAAPLRYGRTTVSSGSVEAYVYDTMVANVTETPASNIYLTQDVSVSQMEKGVELFLSDYPECFWMINDYSYSIDGDGKITRIIPNYRFTGQSLATAKARFDSVVGDVIDSIPYGLTDYEKALYLHDTLAGIVTYIQTGEHQSAYGALVSGQAVCAGYAAAYQVLLNNAGIPAWTVTGVSEAPGGGSVGHAWNVLWLDGNCVYADVTWDDQPTAVFHYYFAISRSEIAAGHTVNSDVFTLPSCGHNNLSYYDVNDYLVINNYSVDNLIPAFGEVENGTRTAVFTSPESPAVWLSNNGYDLYLALGGNPADDLPVSYTISTLADEYALSITGFTDTPSQDIPEPDLEGWVESGEDWYYYKNGEPVRDNWVKDSGKWYFLDEDGSMVTSQWRKDSKGWCYLTSSGAMATNKWVKDSKGWCYVDGSGYCVVNKWVKDSKGWCYLGSDGRMVTNKWVKDSKGWCYVGEDGYCVTSAWKKDSKGWCYLDKNGRMVISDWVKDGGKWYYLNSKGYMVTGTVKIDGTYHKFKSNGVWIGEA